MTKQEVQIFRGDFQKAVSDLEDKYGVNISLGTIRYDVNGLRAKMKAEKGEKIIRLSKDDFQVGDSVVITHNRVNPNDEFEVVKINNKNIKVKDSKGGLINVSPSLLRKL